ncbi:MAG: tetratricopeptide repeat protein [Nitrospiraceae bacterium]|nr:tetratricopeptide repeat protein [Nitrospiraceae bacterium]
MNQTVPIAQALQIAVRHHRSGNLKAAADIYRKILEKEPYNTTALHYLGVIGIQRGDFSAAAGLIERAIGVNSTVPEFFSNLGLALQGAGQLDRAVACFQRAVELKPDYAEAYNNMGSALYSLRKFDEALQSYQQAQRLNPRYAEAWYNQGIVLKDMGRPEEAVESYKRAIELRPRYCEAYNNMGFIWHEQSKHAEAEECYKKATEIDPGYAEAHNNLGAIYLEYKKPDEAIASYRRAIELKPGYADAWNNLGFALNTQAKYEEAADAFRHAIDAKPDYAEAWNNLGFSLRELLKLDEALDAHRRAAVLKPEFAAAYNNMGGIYQQQGKFDEAMTAHRKALAADGNFAAAYLCMTACKKFTAGDEELLETIRKLLDREGIRDEEVADIRFALGKIYDDLGRHEEAFASYHEANRIENRKYEFNREKHEGYISRIIETFTPEFFEQRRDLGSDADLPLMVLGMIRSGTTLVEQIIASHPRVHGAGELVFWEDMEKKHPNEDVPAMTAEVARSIAEQNIDYLRTFSKTAWHITDKMPGNYQRIGLIHTVFPKAKIIHLRRNPVDTCLSIYFHKFAGYHPYGYDLDNLVFYYRQYQRVMEHWRNVLPPDVFHEVTYEELIKDQEEESRKLIAFCGLPWDEKCLRFHRTERPVKTSSNWQVRQPIYKSSMARWKKYEPFLGPLAELLPEG